MPNATLYQTGQAQLATLIGDVDCVITDPPYGPRVHQGQKTKRNDASAGRGVTALGLGYESWGVSQIDEFVTTWHPKTRRWITVLCSHDQIGLWSTALEDAGRYVFAPVPCVIRGMGVRLLGDGPSSWSVYLVAARPRGMKPLAGALPGGYVGGRERTRMPGAKPLWLMRAIVRDYTRVSDLVCDPCCGSGSTLVAARAEGRASVGCEISPAAFAIANERLVTRG